MNEATDQNILYNLRQKHGDRLNGWKEHQILKAYYDWSVSDDYPDEEKFFERLGL